MLTTPRTSAWGPLQVSIDNALQADVGFAAKVGARVYSVGTTPKDGPVPYVELGDSSETPANAFMRGGNQNDETITIVSEARLGKPHVAAIFADVMHALDGQRLAIAGHRSGPCRVALVTVFADPDGVHLRCVARVSVRSFVG